MSIFGAGIFGVGLFGITLADVSFLSVGSVGGGGALSLVWVNPNFLNYPNAGGVLIIRGLSTVIASPVNGTVYNVNNIIGNGTVVGIVDSPGNSFIDTTVIDGVNYFYRVFSFSAAHYYLNGVPSNEAGSTSRAFPLPSFGVDPNINKSSSVGLAVSIHAKKIRESGYTVLP